MKFGVREICDVVLRAKAATKIGNKVFYKNEPVMYFDTLKTSTLEGAATTVYAQGGRGNARLMAWEGERTVTFTMEDALISPEGIMILTGAGLIEASEDKPIYQHVAETTDEFEVTDSGIVIYVDKEPYLPADEKDNFAYVMVMKNGEPVSEPFIPEHNMEDILVTEGPHAGKYKMLVTAEHLNYVTGEEPAYTAQERLHEIIGKEDVASLADVFGMFDSVLVDYYTPRRGAARQINITPDKFGGNYYLEASTLFRDQNGVDMPAEFIIPNCKVQSNFTFTMASSGDPSTFTFTMDAFPDYTRFDKSEKVLASIQIIDPAGAMDLYRGSTLHEKEHEAHFEN